MYCLSRLLCQQELSGRPYEEGAFRHFFIYYSKEWENLEGFERSEAFYFVKTQQKVVVLPRFCRVLEESGVGSRGRDR